MRGTVRAALIIIGLSPLIAVAGPHDDNLSIQQHRPGRKHLPGKKITPSGKGFQNGNTNFSPTGDSGSMNFRPLLGDGAPPSGGPGGGSAGGDVPHNNPPHSNPPDDPPNWGGPIGGDPPHGNPAVPEIDPASGMGALTLLSGALVVLRGRR